MDHGAGDCDSLLFSAGKRLSVLPDPCIIAIRKFHDKIMRVGQFAGPNDLFARSVRLGVDYIFKNRAAEQERFL